MTRCEVQRLGFLGPDGSPNARQGLAHTHLVLVHIASQRLDAGECGPAVLVVLRLGSKSLGLTSTALA